MRPAPSVARRAWVVGAWVVGVMAVGTTIGRRRPFHRWVRVLLVLAAIGLLLLVGFVVYALWPTRTPRIAAPQTPQPALVARGRYLAVLGDCAACHSEPGHPAFSGGKGIASPVGAMYPTNITPDRNQGIGSYTLDDFDRALRHGIRKTGASLYPAMPYPSYSHLTDDDVTALYAYFLLEVRPSDRPNQANGIPFPLSMRWPVAIWRKWFAPPPDAIGFTAARFTDPRVARGAYLAEGLGHCGSCHSPRAFPTMQEKALDNSSSEYLSGGIPIDGWYPVNLRANPDGLELWSVSQIVEALATGRNDRHAVIGPPMNDEIRHSSQHWHADDLAAIAAYLKTLGPAPQSGARYAPNGATATALAHGRDPSEGAALYLDNCSGCHRSTGEGDKRVFPAMAGNSSVLAANPQSLIRLVLGGSAEDGLKAAPSALTMPAFYWRLDDQQVATVLTFIRQSWGNQASKVKASDVASVRADLRKNLSPAALAARPSAYPGENQP